ncbi:uncharacterized protein LOC122088088 [Macadamia integrifolia]|uniref:uncharacterized protein LOC122088088 n=1 Tax=Macadamia integrifolia TaxID=60698 RepID=UPI001C4FF25B|nr:uncharacterized protein LOC122088088 [Macadamia integrifolia]
MSSIGGMVDTLLFYMMERKLFNRLVRNMEKSPRLVKVVIAVWLWLEEIGHYDLIRTLFSSGDQILNAVFDETAMCLNFIRDFASEPTSAHDTPILSTILKELINARFFYYNRDFVREGVSHVLVTVCDIIFRDDGAVELDESAIRPIPRPFGEGSSAQGAVLGRAGFLNDHTSPNIGTSSSMMWISSVPHEVAAVQAMEHMTLNEQSARSSPQVEPLPQDQRSMFLTFSRGYPLRRDEIIEFFTSRWGQVVEDVLIERTDPGVAPQYGRIVFTSPHIIPLVLNGQPTAKFTLRGKHLRARVYVPKKN